MGEDVAIAHLAKGELAVVAVGAEVLKAVEGLTETPKSLAQVGLVPLTFRATGVEAAEMNAAGKAVADVSGTGRPLPRLVGDVVLHAGAGINLGLDGHDGPTEARVELLSVDSLGVAQGVVNVLLGTVDTEAVAGDLELIGGIAKGHEGENPYNDAQGLGIDALEGTDVEGLGIITEEVAEVDSLDEHGRPLLAVEEGNGGEGILDIYTISTLTRMTLVPREGTGT